jgi:hypothetical protein
MKKIITLVAIVPVLALFGGVGILALRISATWNEATTQSLVTALTVVCGGGALVFAILLACIVGIPLAIRAYEEAGASQRAWRELPGSGRLASREPNDWQPVYPPKRQSPMIEGEWSRLPSPPPWGMSGGGDTRLLPPAEQDERFGFDG